MRCQQWLDHYLFRFGIWFVLWMVGYYCTGRTIWCVMRSLQGGDLRDALNDDPAGQLKWHRHGQHIALDIARGLHYLHSHNVRKCVVSRLPCFPLTLLCRDDTAHTAFGRLPEVFRRTCQTVVHFAGHACQEAASQQSTHATNLHHSSSWLGCPHRLARLDWCMHVVLIMRMALWRAMRGIEGVNSHCHVSSVV